MYNIINILQKYKWQLNFTDSEIIIDQKLQNIE